jgi:hypothetical protein
VRSAALSVRDRDPERDGRRRAGRTAGERRAPLVRISELIASVGLAKVGASRSPCPRSALADRLKGKAGIAGALYITVREQRVVIVRTFIKKNEKTAGGEIDLALQRARAPKVVTLTFASWNPLDGWLRQVEALRRAA